MCSYTRHSMLALITICWSARGAEAAHVPPMPSFDPITSSWFATHIVVASSGAVINGEFTVLESWKGNLRSGEKIWIPKLALFADEKERRINLYGFSNNSNQLVSGKRMILFLRRMDYPWRIANGKRDEWLAANRDKLFAIGPTTEIDVSVAWVEDDGVYARRATSFPWPYSMSLYFPSEAKAKESVLEILKLRERFDAALAEKDAKKKVDQLNALLNTKTPAIWIQELMWISLKEGDPAQLEKVQLAIKANPDDGRAASNREIRVQSFLEGKLKGEEDFKKKVINMLDRRVMLEQIRKLSVLWRVENSKPPPPYDSISASGCLSQYLNTFGVGFPPQIGTNPWLREMNLAERQELLGFAEELVRYLKTEPTNLVYQKDLSAICRKIIEELQPAVPEKAEKQ